MVKMCSGFLPPAVSAMLELIFDGPKRLIGRKGEAGPWFLAAIAAKKEEPRPFMLDQNPSRDVVDLVVSAIRLAVLEGGPHGPAKGAVTMNPRPVNH